LLIGWVAGFWPMLQVLSLPLYLLAIVVGGYFFGREALQARFRYSFVQP